MNRVMGLVNLHHHVDLKGLTTNRPVASVSFLGRYAIMDFVLSNFSNSSIDEVGILIKEKPRSLFKHLGNSNAWNFNSKAGGISLLYNEQFNGSNQYNHALNNIKENISFILQSNATDVVIAPDNMINTINYCDIVDEHRKNNSDITMVYTMIDNAKNSYVGHKYINMNEDKVIDILENKGDHDLRKISLNTYVIKKDVLLKLIEQSKSAFYDLEDILVDVCKDYKINGYCYQGYVRCIDSLESYYHTSLEFLDLEVFNEVFKEGWTIYTNTNDTPPAKYNKDACVNKGFVSNGAMIDGLVENSILGRNVKIEKGAVVRNSILLSNSFISEHTIVENAILDKESRVEKCKSLMGDKNNPIYVKQGDLV